MKLKKPAAWTRVSVLFQVFHSGRENACLFRRFALEQESRTGGSEPEVVRDDFVSVL